MFCHVLRKKTNKNSAEPKNGIQIKLEIFTPWKISPIKEEGGSNTNIVINFFWDDMNSHR